MRGVIDISYLILFIHISMRKGDAILQSAVCVKEIGWRNNSRRILLVATDDDFHKAGDGAVR
jgi:hypothetical protein